MSTASHATVQARPLQEVLNALLLTSQAFADASLSHDSRLETIVREMGRYLCCSCRVELLHDEGQTFTTPYARAAEAKSERIAVGAFEVRPQRVQDHPSLKRVVETRDAVLLDRELHVPLEESDRLLAVITLIRADDQPAFDLDDVAFARALARQAGRAIASARVQERANRDIEERERMAARLRVLSEAARDFAAATNDYSDLLATVARRLVEVVGDFCTIRGVSPDGALLETGAVYHADPEVVALAHTLTATRAQRVGEGIMGRIAQTRETVFLPRVPTAEVAASTSPAYRHFIERLDVGSVIGVPMVCNDRIVGVATLLRSGSLRPYDESDLDLVRGVVQHASLAISNAHSYAAEREARATAVSANAALVESEAAHRLLFDASPIPLLVFDVESLDTLAVNDAALRLYGYSRDEFMLAKVSVLTGEGDESVRGRVADMAQAEISGTRRHRRKDGSEVTAQFTTRPLTFAGRRARITVLSDVTASLEAEQTRALLAAIVASSNDAIISKRLDGVITSWNGAAERLFGYPAAEAVGTPITVLIPDDRLHEELSIQEQIAAGGRIDSFQTVRRRKDGSLVAVSVSIAPMHDASGKVVGASKTVRDLSIQRAAEERLRVTEEQLRQAQKMEAVGRLAGGIAHDFNNLLSVILSYADLMSMSIPAIDPVQADLSEIRKAGTSAAELTRQLLTFSRQQVIAPKVSDLNEILAGMDNMLQRILGEDVELVSSLAPSLGRVLVDPSNVEQVVMNLVVNARDAMPTGGQLTIETGNTELDAQFARDHFGAVAGPHVMLAVSDTGVGMDRATQARIFEPFFTTKAVGKGTGLGLSTVFGIAQQAGGSVWVYSEPGEGTTFKIYFPRVEDPLSVARSSTSPETLRGAETILLVEDQEQVRVVALGILERHGYHVIVAQNANDALHLARTHAGTIDLLLTDVVMPLLSGAELAKRISLLRPGINVLYMSGYTDDSVIRHGVLESCMAFLQKPFTVEGLTRKVREVLSEAESVESA